VYKIVVSFDLFNSFALRLLLLCFAFLLTCLLAGTTTTNPWFQNPFSQINKYTALSSLRI